MSIDFSRQPVTFCCPRKDGENTNTTVLQMICMSLSRETPHWDQQSDMGVIQTLKWHTFSISMQTAPSLTAMSDTSVWDPLPCCVLVSTYIAAWSQQQSILILQEPHQACSYACLTVQMKEKRSWRQARRLRGISGVTNEGVEHILKMYIHNRRKISSLCRQILKQH